MSYIGKLYKKSLFHVPQKEGVFMPSLQFCIQHVIYCVPCTLYTTEYSIHTLHNVQHYTLHIHFAVQCTPHLCSTIWLQPVSGCVGRVYTARCPVSAAGQIPATNNIKTTDVDAHFVLLLGGKVTKKQISHQYCSYELSGRQEYWVLRIFN